MWGARVDGEKGLQPFHKPLHFSPKLKWSLENYLACWGSSPVPCDLKCQSSPVAVFPSGSVLIRCMGQAALQGGTCTMIGFGLEEPQKASLHNFRFPWKTADVCSEGQQLSRALPFSLEMLRIEPGTFCIPSQCSTTEPEPAHPFKETLSGFVRASPFLSTSFSFAWVMAHTQEREMSFPPLLQMRINPVSVSDTKWGLKG